MLKHFWLAAACVAMLGTVANAETPRSAEHEQFASSMWNSLQSGGGYASWRSLTIPAEMEMGIPFHKSVKVFGIGTALRESDGIPHGCTMVSAHYDRDGKELVSIAAWSKRELGGGNKHNFWYWVYYSPSGQVLATAGDTAPHSKRGFITFAKGADVWVFRANEPELTKFLKDGDVADAVVKEKAGPGEANLKGANETTLLDYTIASNDYAAFTVEERIWVFKFASAELLEFTKNGELAKNVTRIGEGPQGLTVRGPDQETINGYLRAMGVAPPAQ